MGPDVQVRIDVDKSSYHHLSQSEIGSDNPCSRHLSAKWALRAIKWIIFEWPVIRPESMPNAEITSYKPTSQELSGSRGTG